MTLGILQVVRNLDTGGAQEVVRTLVERLAAMGQRPVVCSLADGPLADDIRRSGVPVELLTARQHDVMSPVGFVRDAQRLRSDLAGIIDRYEIDVVQTHLLRSVDFLAASAARRSSRRPVVFWTFHNSAFTLRPEHLDRHRWLLQPKRFAYRTLYLLGSRRVAGLIAVSNEVKESILRDVGPVSDRVSVVYNGVDVDRFGRDASARREVRAELDVGAEATLVIMVGTFKRQKGHVYLLDAVEDMLPSVPDAHVVLVGDGDLRATIADLVTQRGLGAQVHFLGDRRDVPRLLSASDVFVLPSLWEGLPMALLEAMASELPCVATDVSGVRQVITNDDVGLLVPAGDAAALRTALLRLLSDGDEATAIGERARQRVIDGFSASAQAEEHIRLFRRGIAARDQA